LSTPTLWRVGWHVRRGHALDDAKAAIERVRIERLLAAGASIKGTAFAPISDLGMKGRIGCHTFRATGITAYLAASGTLENAQTMSAHESPRTTKLYDHSGDETFDEVEKIQI
jgi:integrase